MICLPLGIAFPSMPLTPANLFRLAIVLALALHVFFMYSIARAVLGGFGFSLAVAALAMAFSFIMLLPFVWAVTLPEWPEIYTRHVRARRWFRAGRCAACGYQLAGDVETCSECGSTHLPPMPYAISLRTVRTFVIVNLLAWALGCAVGEIWAAEDERAFALEVRQRTDAGDETEYIRARRWPAESSSMIYSPGEGLYVTSRSHN